MPTTDALEHPLEVPQKPWKGRAHGLDAIALAQQCDQEHQRTRIAIDSGADETERQLFDRYRSVIKQHRTLTVNIPSITTALSILLSPGRRYLNYFEFLLNESIMELMDPSQSNEQFRDMVAQRTFFDDSWGDPRRFAETTFKFGCDVKYAAYTIRGCGVTHFGPVCFVFDEDRLPSAVRNRITCFQGDSARWAEGPAAKDNDAPPVSHHDASLLLARFCTATQAPDLACLVNADEFRATAMPAAEYLSKHFSIFENIMEAHLHGDVPLSALRTVRIKKSEIARAKAHYDRAQAERSTISEKYFRSITVPYEDYLTIKSMADSRKAGFTLEESA